MVGRTAILIIFSCGIFPTTFFYSFVSIIIHIFLLGPNNKLIIVIRKEWMAVCFSIFVFDFGNPTLLFVFDLAKAKVEQK